MTREKTCTKMELSDLLHSDASNCIYSNASDDIEGFWIYDGPSHPAYNLFSAEYYTRAVSVFVGLVKFNIS